MDSNEITVSPLPLPITSAIIWQNETPIWNFSEVTAYPMELKQRDQYIPVYVYMKPYSAAQLRNVLKNAVSGYKGKRDIEIVREDKSIYKSLCDDNFVKLGNATGTPEEHRKWLDKFSELKPVIVEHSFAALRADDSEKKISSDVFDISLGLSTEIRTKQDIYDPIRDKVVTVTMDHAYTHPTESQFREYRSARRSHYNRRAAMWAITESHSSLEGLYDTVIRSISGGAVQGEPCTEATKSKWIAGVPLWHKLWLVDQIFGEILEKND
jgi:hypothetical protein